MLLLVHNLDVLRITSRLAHQELISAIILPRHQNDALHFQLSQCARTAFSVNINSDGFQYCISMLVRGCLYRSVPESKTIPDNLAKYTPTRESEQTHNYKLTSVPIEPSLDNGLQLLKTKANNPELKGSHSCFY